MQKSEGTELCVPGTTTCLAKVQRTSEGLRLQEDSSKSVAVEYEYNDPNLAHVSL